MGNLLNFPKASALINNPSCLDQFFYAKRLAEKAEIALSFKLRYQVYCEEKNFLPSCDYPKKIESDGHDSGSIHFGVFNTADEMVGSVRLVPRNQENQFPFHEYCPSLLHDVAFPPYDAALEVSRLVLDRRYRRRKSEGIRETTALKPEINYPPQTDQRQCSAPSIVLCLYKSIYQFCKTNGYSHLYAAMEKPLARLLNRLGFAFYPVSLQFDYYGPVLVYSTAFDAMDRSLTTRNPALMNWFYRDLPPSPYVIKTAQA